MSSKIFKFSALFLFIFCNHLFSQKNNWQITLITKSADSIQGTIYYKNKFKTYHGITVKTNNVSHLYLPKDILSFTITENDQTLYFKSLVVDADYSPVELSKLSFSPKIELTKDTVFAQLLLRGNRSVYFYIDKFTSKNHYVLVEENGKATDLIHKRYYVDENKTATGYNQEYKKQLLLLLASPSISASKINNSQFKKKDILKAVKEYNSSTSPHASVYEYQEERAEFEFGLTAGANFTSLKIDGGNYDGAGLKFKGSFGFNAGINMNVIFPQTQKRWSFYSELLYSSYKMTLKQPYVFYMKENEYSFLTDASVKAAYGKLLIAIRYQTKQQLAPFFQLGVANGYCFQYSDFAKYEKAFYTTTTYEATDNWLKFRKYEQSCFVGAGIKFKNIGLELRDEIGNGFSRETRVRSLLNYAYVLIHYTF